VPVGVVTVIGILTEVAPGATEIGPETLAIGSSVDTTSVPPDGGAGSASVTVSW
jgi:hypothetical protein